MAYRNIEKRIAMMFHKKGKTFERKLRDMPVELLEKWAALPQGGRCIRQAVEEAEAVFWGLGLAHIKIRY
jgi:hypothetical protein